MVGVVVDIPTGNQGVLVAFVSIRIVLEESNKIVNPATTRTKTVVNKFAIPEAEEVCLII